MIKRVAIIATFSVMFMLPKAQVLAQDAGDGPRSPGAATAQYEKAMKDMNEKMKSVNKTGDADHDFIVMMVEHHKGAIAMAETVLKSGSHSELRQMAEKQIKSQRDEIGKLEKILNSLGGSKDSESGAAAKSAGSNKDSDSHRAHSK